MTKKLQVISQLSLFALCFFSCRLCAQSADSLKKFSFGILPSAYYTPETSLGLGALFYTHFNSHPKDTLSRTSNTQTYFSRTFNKQISFENDYQVWLEKDLFYFTGAIDLSRFPEFFFGIGNNTNEGDRQLVSFDMIKVYTKNLVRIKRNIYGGIMFHYQKLYNQDTKLMSNGSCTSVYGNMGYTACGIGPILIIDKRDNPLNPSAGFYLEASYVDYENILTNQNMFTSATLDARKYLRIGKRLIWNANAYISHNTGEVPYRMLPQIGGARFLRGYYRGRFRDNNLIILQHEFRLPIYKIFGLAVFSGIGAVANSLTEFKTNEFRYNYGIGLRVKVNKKENSNLRIDYGFTKHSQGFYVVFAEAF